MIKGQIRKAIFGNKKTTLAASLATLLLSYNVASNPEQATAIGGVVAAIAALAWGQFVSKDGDK
jgi:hypothetical protein